MLGIWSRGCSKELKKLLLSLMIIHHLLGMFLEVKGVDPVSVLQEEELMRTLLLSIQTHNTQENYRSLRNVYR